MEEQLLGMDNTTVQDLRGKQQCAQCAASSVGQMVALGEHIVNFDIDGMLREKVKRGNPPSHAQHPRD